MAVYQCTVCGNLYDEDRGEPYCSVPPGTKFEDLPEDYTCAICGVKKIYFMKIKKPES